MERQIPRCCFRVHKFWQDSQQNLYMGTENGVLGPVRVKQSFSPHCPQDVVAIEDSEGRSWE